MRMLSTLRTWAWRLKRDAITLWFACKHPATPWYAKALGFFVVAYALSPIDLIPDFIPILGYLDEALLLPLFIWLAIRLTPDAVLTACRQQGEDWLARGHAKPRSLFGIVIILLLWSAALWLIWLWWLGPLSQRFM